MSQKTIMRGSRAKPVVRRSSILASAIYQAMAVGYMSLTRGEVAEAAEVCPSLVSRYFAMSELRDAIMEEAVKKNIYALIAQGLLAGDPIALGASSTLKRRAGNYTANL